MREKAEWRGHEWVLSGVLQSPCLTSARTLWTCAWWHLEAAQEEGSVSKPTAPLNPFLHLQGKEGRGQERGLIPRVSTLQQVRGVSLLCTRLAPWGRTA